MPYQEPLPHDFRRAQYLEWCSVEELETMLEKLSKLAFDIQKARNEGIDILAGVQRKHHLFSATVRFPAEGAFICVDRDDWPTKFEQLQSALNFKMPDIAATNKDQTNQQLSFSQNKGSGSNKSYQEQDKDDVNIQSMSNQDKLEKSRLAFTNGISGMRKQLNDALLDQWLFEHKYTIVWKE
jgi:hypothetical protein